MKPAISQVCSLESPVDQDIEDYAASGCRAIEGWFTKLETSIAARGEDRLRRLLDTHEVTIPVASFQGGLLTSQGERRAEAWKLFASRLELCDRLSIDTIVVACDAVGPLGRRDLERAQRSLEQVALECSRRGLRAALEFQVSAAFGNNLQTAAAMVAETGSPHLGICLDAFHFFVGPSKTEDLAYLTKENLFHVQVADVLGAPRELAGDSDRILPGDGDWEFEPLLDRLRQIEYDGLISLELMNPQIWRIPALQLGEVGVAALDKLLGRTET
ncbi:MAG: sugar phosphate isomerase/epimerase [Pirellulaceae bacterium]|jgi:4-hydroxyphenylpyruvate dioxygenase|nr:sugar phosphate isomerase/epimerase [Pirellulaceae bacterium]MDP7016569.1 sugar phosphate isomerase/epimerase [Pirellulaceae bacterium]